MAAAKTTLAEKGGRGGAGGTDAVVDEFNEWPSRPLESVYDIVYIDALVVKIRDQGKVENKAVHIAVGVDEDGTRDVLGGACSTLCPLLAKAEGLAMLHRNTHRLCV